MAKSVSQRKLAVAAQRFALYWELSPSQKFLIECTRHPRRVHAIPKPRGLVRKKTVTVVDHLGCHNPQARHTFLCLSYPSLMRHERSINRVAVTQARGELKILGEVTRSEEQRV